MEGSFYQTKNASRSSSPISYNGSETTIESVYHFIPSVDTCGAFHQRPHFRREGTFNEDTTFRGGFRHFRLHQFGGESKSSATTPRVARGLTYHRGPSQRNSVRTCLYRRVHMFPTSSTSSYLFHTRIPNGRNSGRVRPFVFHHTSRRVHFEGTFLRRGVCVHPITTGSSKLFWFKEGVPTLLQVGVGSFCKCAINFRRKNGHHSYPSYTSSSNFFSVPNATFHRAPTRFFCVFQHTSRMDIIMERRTIVTIKSGRLVVARGRNNGSFVERFRVFRQCVSVEELTLCPYLVRASTTVNRVSRVGNNKHRRSTPCFFYHSRLEARG